MTRKWIVGFVLADFALLNVYAVTTSSINFFEYLRGLDAWGTLLFVDLCIALSMVTIWMWKDARSSGRSPGGYALLTIALGSIGPLVYLLTRDADEVAARGVATEATAGVA